MMTPESNFWESIQSIREPGTEAHATLQERFVRPGLLEYGEKTWSTHGVGDDGALYTLAVAEYEPESVTAGFLFGHSSIMAGIAEHAPAGIPEYTPDFEGRTPIRALYALRLLNGHIIEAYGQSYALNSSKNNVGWPAGSNGWFSPEPARREDVIDRLDRMFLGTDFA